MSTNPVAAKAGRPKSIEKRNQILCSSAELFLSHGYSNTSMDLVAKHSGVSKQTVYSHFANKDALFVAVIDFKSEEYSVTSADSDHEDLRTSLHLIGRHFLNLLQDPQVIAMFRLVISEAGKAPHVAELFYRAGPMQVYKSVREILDKHLKDTVEDKAKSRIAMDFISLLKGQQFMMGLLGLGEPMNQIAIDKQVEQSLDETLAIIELSVTSR